MLLATPYLPFPIGIAPHNRSPLHLAIDALSSIALRYEGPILSALCTIRLNSVHKHVVSKRQSLTVAVTLVHQRCRCHKASKTSYTCPLQFSQFGPRPLSRPCKCQFPLAIRILPRGNVAIEILLAVHSVKRNQLIECRIVLVADVDCSGRCKQACPLFVTSSEARVRLSPLCCSIFYRRLRSHIDRLVEHHYRLDCFSHVRY